jgi:hypothetical protein
MMPIEYAIDHARRLVLARGQGVFTDHDIFGYQLEVWSRSDVAGFDELVDMTAVEAIAFPTADRISQLAELSSDMDATTGGGKFAIVAPEDFAFGLGRMYEIYRDLNPRSTKQVGVFRTMAEAMKWLGREEPCPNPHRLA